MTPVPFAMFAAGWLAALAVSVAGPAPAPEPSTILVEGITIPLVTCTLGAIGVLAARPLARGKAEKALPLGLFLLVTGIMLTVVQLWIVQARPGWLFAFVVAIGLGFSGYSLIELIGDQLKELVRTAFESAKASVRSVLGGKTSDPADGNTDKEVL